MGDAVPFDLMGLWTETQTPASVRVSVPPTSKMCPGVATATPTTTAMPNHVVCDVKSTRMFSPVRTLRPSSLRRETSARFSRFQLEAPWAAPRVRTGRGLCLGSKSGRWEGSRTGKEGGSVGGAGLRLLSGAEHHRKGNGFDRCFPVYRSLFLHAPLPPPANFYDPLPYLLLLAPYRPITLTRVLLLLS